MFALSVPPPLSSHEPARALGAHGGRVLDRDELGAEAAGLVRRPLGELGALEAAGEAEVVLDPARLAGLAARGLALDEDRAQPLGRAVDGGGEPGGAAADDDEVVVREARLVGDAEALGELEQRGPLEDRAVLEQRDRQPVVVDRRDPEQLARLAVALDVEPARRDPVAGEEVADVVRLLREAVADDAHPAGLERGAVLPRREEVLDDRVQALLGRVPGLAEVVVEVDLVDRLDRRLGVGVRGEEHALGVGDDLARLDEVVGPGHAGHALVGDEHRDLLAAGADLADEVQRLGAGGRAQDPVAVAEAAAQVAGDGGEDRGLVVDGDDRGAALALAPGGGRLGGGGGRERRQASGPDFCRTGRPAWSGSGPWGRLVGRGARAQAAAAAGTSGNVTPVSVSESSHRRRAMTAVLRGAAAADERRVAALLLEAVGADEAVAGEVLRRGVQRREGAHVLALGEDAVSDGAQDVHQAAARPRLEVRGGVAGVHGHRADRRPGIGEAALELGREEEVRELRLAVRAPRVVGAALPVEVVEVDLADPVAGRGDGDDAVADLRQQEVREREVAEVVRADLQLEPVGGARARGSP